jgi:hypothetical protein
MLAPSAEKYHGELLFRLMQLRRQFIRLCLKRIVRWEPLVRPENGYTIIIGCNATLARLLGCNLKFLARQNLPNVVKILIVLDRPRQLVADDVEPIMRERFPHLPLEFLYYSHAQRAMCAIIRWPWVQSWLSWSMGIGKVRTKYALLHDLDASLLRPDIVEKRYQVIREKKDHFIGVRLYSGNGIEAADGLVTTFELMFDAQFVRQKFAPLDLFNHVARFRGRRVDFDTFLFAQSLAGRASVLKVAEEDMVHPSQLICHFEDLLSRRKRVPPSNNLLFVPYLLYASEEPDVLLQMTHDLEHGEGPHVPYFGNSLDLSGISPELLRWLAKQAYRLELSDAGRIRNEVVRYFTAVDAFIARATGRQTALGSPETELAR